MGNARGDGRRRMTVGRRSARRAGIWGLGLLAVLAAGSGPLAPEAQAGAPARPNIVLIYADDLGYGDVGCYGATRVRTPNVDRLTREGLRFTDGHAAAATCTPSRYALLTGEYAWRRKGTNVLPGDAPLIVPTDRATLPALLKAAGYATGVVGKWHLGLGRGAPDWNGEIAPGPLDVGFDEAFIIPATGDRVPCVYVEGRRVVGLDPGDPVRVAYGRTVGDEPTGKTHPQLLRVHPSHGHDQTIVDGIGRIGSMSGGRAARWVDEGMADTLTRAATRFLERHKAGPFFLYFATHDIHVPRVPNRRFVGQTGMGPRGDAIAQFDWSAGEILKALDRLGLAENTLVILTSDNGPVVDDGYLDGAVELLGEHRPAGPLRGGKYSAFEGGTRVPWLVRWPARIRPGMSAALVSQVDLLASLATLVGRPLAPGDAPDSLDMLPALLGESTTGRAHLVEQAGVLSLRQSPWKLIEPGQGPRVLVNTNTETGQAPEPQLYSLDDDPGERADLAARHPEKVRELRAVLESIRQGGERARRDPR